MSKTWRADEEWCHGGDFREGHPSSLPRPSFLPCLCESGRMAIFQNQYDKQAVKKKYIITGNLESSPLVKRWFIKRSWGWLWDFGEGKNGRWVYKFRCGSVIEVFVNVSVEIAFRFDSGFVNEFCKTFVRFFSDSGK